MRSLAFLLPALALAGCQQLQDAMGGSGAGAGADAGTAEGGGPADAAIVGAGCGVEASSGAELCIATSMCPSVVVDTEALPGCGFRVRGAAVDLVCACGTALCPMGLFSTCAEATELLTTQTAQNVCVQVAEGRCFEPVRGADGRMRGMEGTPRTPPATGGTSPACDRECLRDCGGGAACASVCNCD